MFAIVLQLKAKNLANSNEMNGNEAAMFAALPDRLDPTLPRFWNRVQAGRMCRHPVFKDMFQAASETRT